MLSTPISEQLQKKVKDKAEKVAATAPDMPGMVTIHDISTYSVECIFPKGEELLGMSLNEIRKLGPEYHSSFFKREDVKLYFPKIPALL